MRLRRSIALVSLALVGLGTGLVASASPASAAAVSSCRPTAAHPYPVVLVHGTLESSSQWDQFAPTLTARGYCVSRIDYSSTQDVAVSAKNLQTYVGQVLAATGASKVDIVGHSQGGMMPRHYLKFLGGAAKVHSLVGISPSNHGTTLNGIANLAAGQFNPIGFLVAVVCTSCAQQVIGSDFLTNLNKGGDTVAGVNYTVIESNKDAIVTPYTNALLTGAGVNNVVIQNVCPADASGHNALANEDRNAWQVVYNALDPAHAQPVACVPATTGF